ncbi:MAG: hypothetical protein LUF33_07820 [Clostridiales bacterium]|nr:hypothetical protein [Clostridiales bacterium]
MSKVNKETKKEAKQKKRSEARLRHESSVQNIKNHKVLTGVYFVIRAVIIVILVISLIRGQWENTMTCVLSFLLLMMPTFIERRLKIDIPSVMEIIVIVFVFAANVLGEMGAFYERIPMWDTMLHTLNGFICAGVGFGLIDILNRNEKVKMDMSPLFVCLFSFCFSMTAGTVWEFFEFSADMLLGKDMQKDTIITSINSVLLSGGGNQVTHISGITDTLVNGESLGINGYLDIGIIDTMKDLLVNFLGAIVFNVIGFFYLKGRGKRTGFIQNFIPKRIKEAEDGQDNASQSTVAAKKEEK